MKWWAWASAFVALSELPQSLAQRTTTSVGLTYCPPPATASSPQPTIGPYAPYYLFVAEGPGGPFRYLNEQGQLTNITEAAQFIFTKRGRLRVRNRYVSTDKNIRAQPFSTSPRLRSISTTFAPESGLLRWRNSAFVGLEAAFCRTDDAVTVTFNGSLPSGCRPVLIGVVLVARFFEPATSTGTATTKSTTTTDSSSSSLSPSTSSLSTSKTESTSAITVTTSNTASNSISLSSTTSAPLTSSQVTTISTSLITTGSSSTAILSTTTSTAIQSNTEVSTSSSAITTDSQSISSTTSDASSTTTTQATTAASTTDAGTTTAILTTSDIMSTAASSDVLVTTTSSMISSTIEDLTTRTIPPPSTGSASTDSGSTTSASTKTTASTSPNPTSPSCSTLPLSSQICPPQDQKQISLGGNSPCYGILCSKSLLGTVLTANSTVANSLRACAGYCSLYNTAIPYGCLGVNFLGATVPLGQNNCLLYTDILEEDSAGSGVDSVRLIYPGYPNIQKREVFAW